MSIALYIAQRRLHSEIHPEQPWVNEFTYDSEENARLCYEAIDKEFEEWRLVKQTTEVLEE